MQKIKERSIQLFKKACYEEAFSVLWEMDGEQFAVYVLNVNRRANKADWLQHKDCGKYFWNTFIVQPSIFHSLLQTEYAKELIDKYFEFRQDPNDALLLKLAREYPEILLESIRTNMIFLRDGWQVKLTSLESVPTLQTHFKTWKTLYKLEKGLWEQVEKRLTPLHQFTIYELLAEVVVWLELKRFGKNDNHSIHFLARIYSFFIEKILPITDAFRNHSADNSKVEFYKVFLARFQMHGQTGAMNSPVAELLDHISTWLRFMEGTCEPYCYDLQTEPIIENEVLSFRSSPQHYYSTLVDGIRYEVVQFHYLSLGIQLTDYREETGEIVIPKGRKPGDEELNRDLAGYKHSTFLALLDLSIDRFADDGKNFRAIDVLSPLITYSTNRRTRYERALQKHSPRSSSWFEAHMKLSMESIREDILKEPYLFTSVADFQILNLEAVGASHELTTAMVNLFGYTPSDKYSGLRHSCRYDVWNNPLLKIGSELFCPIVFFASNMWFYSFMHNALLTKARDKKSWIETDAMEKHLGKRFERSEWKVKVIKREEANKIIGDVDLIIEGSDETLLIQLKRTYLRLNVKDSYAETRMIDRKAADQLNQAELWLRIDNDVYNLGGKCRKWIVTTSLENIQSEINGCRKINYFELLIALHNQDLQTIQGLIKYVEQDTHLSEICEVILNKKSDTEAMELLQSLGLPIPVFEPKAYHIDHITNNEAASLRYSNMFNDALHADKSDDKNVAIDLFHKCTLMRPNDAEAWSALANCLGDTQQYSLAFICFEKALALLPVDPFITRNFAIALIEAGRSYEGINRLMDLFCLYPLMSTLKLDIVDRVYHTMQQRRISPDKLTAINQRMKVLFGESE